MVAAVAQIEDSGIATGFPTRASIDSMTRSGSDEFVIPAKPSASEGPLEDTGTVSNEQKVTTAFAKPTLVPIVRVPFPDATPAEYSFDMRGQWEGRVISISAHEFSVVLLDIANPDGEEYDATFSTEEVANEDLDLLQVGAVFYWTIGYQQRRGQRLRVSEIRFRRLPAWSRADLARVEKATRDLDDLFAP